VVTIRLFGHARFETGTAVSSFRVPPRAIAVLAYLIVHRDAPVDRRFLAETFWPDDDVNDARANLRRHLHVLAQTLPPAPDDAPYLLATMKTIRWNPNAPALVDTIAFTEAARAGRLDEATALYTGAFLESFVDEWIVAERERFASVQLDCLRATIQRKRGERDFVGALAGVGHMLAIDPWREDAVRIEMAVRAQLGDRSGALAAYRQFAERLRAELDVEPTPETRALHDALARGDDPEPNVARDHATRIAPPAPTAMPFVGRGAEFERLAQLWSASAYGSGSVVLLGGEAGVGKSRLAQELALLVESQGGGVLVGATSPGEARPYEAVVDALRGALSLVVPSLGPSDLEALSRVLPEIAAGAPVVESVPRGPEAERQRIFEAVRAAIAVLARKRPLLIVLEDLHWTTGSSAALLEYLGRRVTELTVLVLGTFREEEVGRTHPLRGVRRRLENDGSLQHLALARLEASDVATIVRRVRPDADDIDGVARELFARSEGVPLFLDEALYAAASGDRSSRLNVPARVEKLEESARVVLEIAAVAGTGFNLDVLGEVAGWSESEILRGLDALVEARFVREGRRRRFGDYAFSHHLVHAAVYEAIPEAARRRRHALVARATEALYADRPDLAFEIARHYDRAGDAERAALAYLQAARHARALFANEETLAYAERGLELCVDPHAIIDLHVLRAWAGHALGRSEPRARSIAALATLAIARQQLPDVERLRATHAMIEGRFDVSRAAAERFLEAATANGDADMIRLAHVELATIAIVTDRYDDAERHLREARARLAETGDVHLLRLMGTETFLLQRRGAHDDELMQSALRLLDAARSAGDPRAEAEANVRLAHVDMAAHRFAEARARLDAAADAYGRFGSPRGVDSVRNNAANLALWTADYTAAGELYASCFRFAEENGDEANVFGCTLGMTLAAIYTGDLHAARASMQRVEHLPRSHATMEDANWQLCRALIAMEAADARAASAAFDAALAIHRARPPSALFALTLAFAAHAALDAADVARGLALDAELGALPAALLGGEEFPHLMYWARARAAALRADGAAEAAFLAEAARLYDERVAPLGEAAATFAAVPWNARFSRADAFRTVRR
jgi:DNA-binding SARP family transcriptional activator/energy-coupling factor transporter ATP-binding protein EcfA2